MSVTEGREQPRGPLGLGWTSGPEMAGPADHWEAGRVQQVGMGREPPSASGANHHQPGQSSQHVGPEHVQIAGQVGEGQGHLQPKGQ